VCVLGVYVLMGVCVMYGNVLCGDCWLYCYVCNCVVCGRIYRCILCLCL